VELALEAGAPTKTHMLLNRTFRWLEGARESDLDGRLWAPLQPYSSKTRYNSR
jgi:hypothetical protein